LDDLGIRHGTDLSSFGRDCLRTWEPLLAPLRAQAFDLLEVGVGAGASLRVWREWFPRARLAGLDARRIALEPPIANCTIVQGQQCDPAVMRRLLQRYRFRVIVDDGSPHVAEKIETFLSLFPWLEPGGVYLCPGPAVGSLMEPLAHGGAPDPAWFADLGLAIASSHQRDRTANISNPVDQARQHAHGVHLFRTSVAVTS
jgi:hypothetical protein